MDRQTMISRVKARFGDPNNEIFDADYYCNAINEAYEAAIAASPFWPFLETNTTSLNVTAGNNSMTLPTDAFRVLTVFNSTDKLTMNEITGRRSYVDLYPEGSASPGTPIQYRVFNNTLQVYPHAQVATTFSIDYAVRPARLTLDASTPVIPSEFHRALVEHALATANLDDGNTEQFQAHMQSFTMLMEEMKAQLLTVAGDSYPQINDAWTL